MWGPQEGTRASCCPVPSFLLFLVLVVPGANQAVRQAEQADRGPRVPAVWAEGRAQQQGQGEEGRTGARRTGYQSHLQPRGSGAGSWLCSATWRLEGSCRWKVTPGPRRNHRHINHWPSFAAVLFSAYSGPSDPPQSSRRGEREEGQPAPPPIPNWGYLLARS